MSAPAVEIEIDSPLWTAEPGTETCVREAIAAAAARVPSVGEVSVLLTDDAAVRSLNCDWRGIDKATNVLSFSAAKQPPGLPPMLGDIAIAYESLAREADAEGKPALHHLAHLVVHGYLHLMDYDHQTDPEAETMEALERDILRTLLIPDPFRTEATDPA